MALLINRLFIIYGCLTMTVVAETIIYDHALIFDGYNLLSDNAFMVKDDRFLALGKSEDFLSLPYKRIDLKGYLVMPGFIDSHAHIMGLGKSKLILNLKGLSQDDIIAKLNQEASKQAIDTWIYGRGWDQNLWPHQAFPHKRSIDHIKQPLALVRVDGHALWVNDAALSKAGITKHSKDPSGGHIDKDSNGELNGILIDTAMDLVERHQQRSSKAELKRYLDEGIKEALKHGVTSLHDAGGNKDMLNLFIAYAKENKLLLRLYSMIDGRDDSLVNEYLKQGPIDINNHLSIRAIKYFADGALGSRGALLLDDYADAKGQRGLSLISFADLVANTKKALKANFQVATHAIGDAANRLVLDAYEKALHDIKPKDARLRIEHAQLVDEKDHERFFKLKIIASMQPIHCTADMAWAPKRLGTARLGNKAYPWRSLLKNGTILALGSDSPVENINPLEGIYAAVSRKNIHDHHAFLPEEKLTLGEALSGYFSHAAYAEFKENEKGAIKPGYLADFIVFKDNIFHLAPKDFIRALPLMTVVGGKTVYGGI